MNEPVDGSLVIYSSAGLIVYGIARGYHHPEHGVVAQPYRDTRCRLVRSVPRLEWLPCLQRNAPLTPREQVLAVLSPWSLISQTMLPGAVLRLIEELSPDLAGVTGSFAVGCGGPGSDVDIVIYNSDPGEIARELAKLRSRGIIRQCALPRVARKRRERPDYSASARHILRSRVESCYRGIPFTLRVLRAPRGFRCDAWEARRAYAGKVRAVLRLMPSDPDSILVPARYRGIVVSGPSPLMSRGDEIIVESFRTRYADLEPGTYVIRGEAFLERDGTITLSPDLWGGVWRAG